MPTQAPQRRTSAPYRNRVTPTNYGTYGTYGQTRSEAARVYDYPPAYPNRTTTVRPRPQKEEKPQQQTKRISKADMLKMFLRIALVVGMCMLMLYRYAAILESSDRIEKLHAEVAALEAKNQAIQSKIDRGLELGALEAYATGQLGMIRPDNSQMFYIDMQLGDETRNDAEDTKKEAGSALQGTPGALVHAIEVLN